MRSDLLTGPWFAAPHACQYPPVPTNLERRLDQDVQTALSRYDPYWGAQLVLGLAILLSLSLSEKLTPGPTWLLPALEGLTLVGLMIASPRPRMRHNPLRRHLALTLIAVVSAANAYSLVLLVHYLLKGGRASGHALIGSGMVLWINNVLLFGVWYWQLDGGGPRARTLARKPHPDFLFPQMTDDARPFAPPGWEPRLVDYLYTSLTNATAFSPTDTMPLTPMAKSLMAAQSLVALVTIGLVVARAVNIL
ncbi:MAG: hypothetical protein ACXVE2_07690 [Solirubrobacteraceae bacterium]